MYLMVGKVPLEPLAEGVVKGFIEARFAAAGMRIEADAADLVFGATEGIPFYVQKLGVGCWLKVLSEGRDVVTEQDVADAYGTMLWELDAEYEARFQHKYGTQQKAILLALAERSPLRREDLAEAVGRPSGQLSSSLTALEAAMEVRKLGWGTYAISDPVFAAWIRRRVAPQGGAGA